MCAPTAPCVPSPCFRVEAPLGESTVLSAVVGAGAHRVRWSSCAGVGLRCVCVCVCVCVLYAINEG